MSTVKQQYDQFKVEYETLEKMLHEENIRRVNLENGLTRIRLCLNFQKQGVTREQPVGFMAGGNRTWPNWH
jgi:hypothetical protein